MGLKDALAASGCTVAANALDVSDADSYIGVQGISFKILFDEYDLGLADVKLHCTVEPYDRGSFYEPPSGGGIEDVDEVEVGQPITPESMRSCFYDDFLGYDAHDEIMAALGGEHREALLQAAKSDGIGVDGDDETTTRAILKFISGRLPASIANDLNEAFIDYVYSEVAEGDVTADMASDDDEYEYSYYDVRSHPHVTIDWKF